MAPIDEKEYIDKLREADQRAVDLLASARANQIKTEMLMVSILISMVSIAVAVIAIIISKH